ncbi:hypothetical protein BCR44DRAFT_57156 [Catenaria anguillulae PL171]|uniref:Uncharacterized protein n=1 Tax=Catenaria anguillulae PL171 TaxID=765915 RepID=A0A1Y2HVA7_9FUNG|nr:hypothetical protein BCR44DRAFT_57156 [Catenaria anguillulae PL171]
MRPEDYMDEEDLEEALDGKQLRAIQHQRASDPKESRTQQVQSKDLLGLLVPATQSDSADSPGHRLLRRLGFRSALSTSSSTTWPSFIPPTKRDRHGLGYHSTNHVSIIRPLSEPTASSSSRKRAAPLGIRGGIGVGILNEDDMDEDVAVYSDQEDDEGTGLGRVALPRLSKKHPIEPASKAYDTPIGATDVCSDGMRAIPGFIVCARGVVLSAPAATVRVPEGWKPKPPIAKLPPPGPTVLVPPLPPGTPFPPMPLPPLTGLPVMRLPHGLSIPPPPPLPSGMPQLPIPPPPPLPSMAAHPTIKKVSKEIAQAALNAPHKPFTGDKRARFLAYCEFCAGNSTDPPILSDAEQSEFASTASLFRPMSAMLEARFTRAEVQVGDATPAAADTDAGATTSTSTAGGDPAASAAAMSMFGAMTRTITDFFPTRLVCKRFGVAPPHGKHNAGGSGPSGLGGDVGPEVDEHLNEATMQSILEGARGANPFKLDPRSHVAAETPAHVAWVDPLASMPRPPQEVFDKIFGDAVARLAQRALGPALDAEDMPQVEVGEGETHIAADAVARVLAMHQLEDAGIAVPPALRVKGEAREMAQAGEYERVDERDALAGTTQVDSFKPRLFKRKRAADADVEADEGERRAGAVEGKKNKRKRVGAKTTTLSFGDEF